MLQFRWGSSCGDDGDGDDDDDDDDDNDAAAAAGVFADDATEDRVARPIRARGRLLTCFVDLVDSVE